jgi:galactose mutarotase-like enzyme
MKVAFAGLITLAATALAAPFGSQQVLPWDNKSVYEKHTIKAKGIEASFIEYGAVITNLWVNDKDGVSRDIILGWDDTTQYNVNAQHPYFGGKYLCRV